MFKKTLSAITLAALLSLGVATAASAYVAPGGSLTCDSTTVEPNETLECTIEGPNGSDATLAVTTNGDDATIAGTTSMTKTISSGVATFTVTMPSAPGEVSISALIDGAPVGAAVITIAADSGAGGSLASTGSDNTGLGLTAAAMLLAGAGVLAFAARRKSAQYSTPAVARASAGADV